MVRAPLPSIPCTFVSGTSQAIKGYDMHEFWGIRFSITLANELPIGQPEIMQPQIVLWSKVMNIISGTWTVSGQRKSSSLLLRTSKCRIDTHIFYYKVVFVHKLTESNQSRAPFKTVHIFWESHSHSHTLILNFSFHVLLTKHMEHVLRLWHKNNQNCNIYAWHTHKKLFRVNGMEQPKIEQVIELNDTTTAMACEWISHKRTTWWLAWLCMYSNSKVKGFISAGEKY